MKRILVVEDDLKIAEFLVDALNKEGFIVELCKDQFEFYGFMASKQQFDLYLLDRLISNFDSKELIPLIKKTQPDSFIFILSAINTPIEKANLIDLGADDYLAKPFSTSELMARVNSLFRRSHKSTTQYKNVGNTIIDFISRTVNVGERQVVLPSKEFAVLRLLSGEPGRVYSKMQIFESGWGNFAQTESNVIEATVNNVRRRLEQIGSDLQIKNIRNVGYWVEK